MSVRACGIFAVLLLGAWGCASQPKPQAEPKAVAAAPVYGEASAGALVFDPPVIAGQPRPELARQDRIPGAFVGYESITATYFWVRVDDRMDSDFNDRYERRAISTRVGVSYR